MPQRRFRKRRTPRSRWRNWWLIWRVPLLLLIVMIIWWFGIRPITHERDWVNIGQEFTICGSDGASTAGCVVDGDTVIIGFGSERRRIRLTGFDAPELDGACEAESERAIAARITLYQWLSEDTFEWSGGDDPPYDQYGRELREARRTNNNGNHEYLATIMIERELASESGWGAFPRDWCASARPS